MVNGEQPKQRGDAAASSSGAAPSITVPKVELPTGGGAIRAVDEQFQVNGSNGTGQLSVPLSLPTGRSGFAPSVGLSYDSGSGNGVFGLGWTLTIASISRRTDHRLPRYEDDVEGDVFTLTGAEDLVPALVDDGTGWTLDEFTAPTGELVKRYRPRSEGSFARIERITPVAGQPFYWKVTTSGNVVTIYGRGASARLADPQYPERVYRWLPELSYDDKGQVLEYEYAAEDLQNVPATPAEANRRAGVATFANTYPKRIRYANKTPYYADPAHPYAPAAPASPAYLFEVVFDYGDHDPDAPTPLADRAWPCRLDPFSTYKPGFEVRTYRLCQRVLVFHVFKELNDGITATPCLVRSIDVGYRLFGNAAATASELRNIEVDYPTTFTRTAYRRAGATYERASHPPVRISYQEPAWDTTVKELAAPDLANLPVGLGPAYQWIDLFGEGVSGVLAEEGNGWFYKRNLGNGQFAPARPVVPKPSFLGVADGSLAILDLEGDGRKFVVSTAPPVLGSFELSDDNEWKPFRSFERAPNIDARDPNVRMLDLDGDGRPELVMTEDSVFTWFANAGVAGYDGPARTAKPLDEERGPAVVFADAASSVFLADMSGDGLTDIVRIRVDEVCYWPNLGFGRFGAKVAMANAPVLDAPEAFDAKQVHLADITGTGVADLVYANRSGVRVWRNQTGNSWTEETRLDQLPTVEEPNQLAIIDLLATGTPCVVFSSPLPRYQPSVLKYVDLLGGVKPFIVNGYRNSLGKVVTWQYRSSAQFLLDDLRAGRPWVTKLPFPVQCIAKVTMTDEVTRAYLTSEYRYHHGYYDHVEREFRGFGLVEQVDTETFDDFVKSGASNVVDQPLHQPPVLTRTWFHVGAFFDDGDIRGRYRGEFFRNPVFTEHVMPDPELAFTALSPQERREAARACKGAMLRQETYALDEQPGLSEFPYSVVETALTVQQPQPLGPNRNAVFLVTPTESISYGYERVPSDPRITHTLTTKLDELGHACETASVAYPRQVTTPGLPPKVVTEQQALHVTYAREQYTNDIAQPHAYRLRASCEHETFELTGIVPAAGYFARKELHDAFAGAAAIDYDATPSGAAEKRPLTHTRTIFRGDDTVTLLPLGTRDPLGLIGRSYTLAYTPALLADRFGTRVTVAHLVEGGYARSGDLKIGGVFPASDPDDDWWVPSAEMRYPAAPSAAFYLADRYVDAFGNQSSVRYVADYFLLVESVTDPVGNVSTAEQFDFRLLAPVRLRDCNDNISESRHDLLGFVVGTAVRGKGAEADDLVGFVADLTPAQIASFFADPVTEGPALLQHATTRLIYDLSVTPGRVATITREVHYRDAVASGQPSPLQYSFAYSSGTGQVAMTKVQAKPGLAKQLDASNNVIEVDTSPALRWIGTGRTVLNNKGKPVKQYEPYFSVTHLYEDSPALVEIGVSPVTTYDPLGRAIRVDSPDGTFSRVDNSPWRMDQYDPNDTVLASRWYADRTTGALAGNVRERDAAIKAAVHHDTPSTSHLDSLGRAFYAVAKNRWVDPATLSTVEETYEAYTVLDIESHQVVAYDERGNLIGTTDYDRRGSVAYRVAPDSGEHWTFPDCNGSALYDWTIKGGVQHEVHTLYDAARRPSSIMLRYGTATPIEIDRSVYGEGQPSAKALNLRGRGYEHFDQAGRTRSSRYDFKGNLLESKLVLTRDYDVDIDWSSSPVLETEEFTTSTVYDALNRPVEVVAPTSDPATADVSLPTYNASGKLQTMSARLRGAATPTRFVENEDYDEKGQRTRIDYRNGTSTIFKYDPMTFRLVAVVTARGIDPELLWRDPSTLSQPGYRDACIQYLRYTWDPIGNITFVRDDAQQTIYFDNAVVDPSCDYTYDAMYRLIQAVGREHIGQSLPPDATDASRMGNPQPGTPTQMRSYTQRYTYDRAGNMLSMSNVGSWNRTFTYAATGNQLITAPGSGDVGTPFTYTYDEHGSMRAMPHLDGLQWSFKDELRHVTISTSANQHAWYVYSAGARMRKVVRKGAVREERIYLGNRERYRRYRGGTLEMERETFHIVDDKRRIAMVDTPTVQPATSHEVRCIRHQYANHLGTACVELDDAARVISYEEYYPFGSTSYQATDQTREVAAKRYRYTAMERDEESGLSYHGTRYYAPWLARWTAADPAGTNGGLNLYAYCSNNPISVRDPRGTDGEVCGVYDEDAMVCRTEACVPATLSPEVPTGPPASPTAPRVRIRRQPARLPAPPPPPPPPPAPTGQVIEPPPPVSPTDYTLYVPPGFLWTQYNAALREVDDSSNPWWGRAGMFVLAAAASIPATAEEYIARPIANVPFTMHNAGIGIGEHAGRAYLWAQQGETGEAVVESLHAVVSTTQGINAGLSVAIPVSGALESRATATTATLIEDSAAADTSSTVAGDTAAADTAASGEGSTANASSGSTTNTPANTPAAPAPLATTWQQHEADVVARLRAANPGVTVGEQVTLDVTNTTTGQTVRIRIDAIYRNGSGQYQLVDAKFSSVSDLTTGSLDSTVTTNQSVAYGWIRSGQSVRVVPAGARAVAAGLPPGTGISIAPTVEMHVNSATGIVVRTY
jgi:RHS repeat-associated protein